MEKNWILVFSNFNSIPQVPSLFSSVLILLISFFLHLEGFERSSVSSAAVKRKIEQFQNEIAFLTGFRELFLLWFSMIALSFSRLLNINLIFHYLNWFQFQKISSFHVPYIHRISLLARDVLFHLFFWSSLSLSYHHISTLFHAMILSPPAPSTLLKTTKNCVFMHEMKEFL